MCSHANTWNKCRASLWHLFFNGLGCSSMYNFGSESSWFALTVALSLQCNITIVALFVSASGLDRKGCCMHRSPLCGIVTEQTHLWVVPQSGHVRLIRDPFSFFGHSYSVPTGFSLLDNSDCLLGMQVELVKVPHDQVDTLNSTLRSGVSFLSFDCNIHCRFEFFLVWDWQVITSTSSCALLGL
jgi:hypothetical protein